MSGLIPELFIKLRLVCAQLVEAGISSDEIVSEIESEPGLRVVKESLRR